MNQVKQKILLLAKVGCVIITLAIVVTACSDDDCRKPISPKWEAPQPIDTALLGSWELVEDDNFGSLYLNQIITFYENNKCIRRIIVAEKENECENRWSVNGDTLVLPDYFDSGTGRFGDYTYSLSADGNFLYLNLINYPFVGCGVPTDMLIMPLAFVKGTFKKLEE